MQRQLAVDAEKNGMTVPQFIEFIKKKQQETKAIDIQIEHLFTGGYNITGYSIN